MNRYGLILVVLIGTAVACRQTDGQSAPAAVAAGAVYQCPMHPEVVRDKPGKCPVCHMDLVLRQPESGGTAPSGGADSGMGRSGIKLSAARQQLIGVTFAVAETRELVRRIQASGRVAYDPALYAAIEEYRQALQTAALVPSGVSADARGIAQSIVKSTRMKLRLLGLSDPQIDAIATSGPESAAGLVIGKAGGSVWVYADVYEYEMNLVKPGQTMTITSPALPGEVYSAKVLAVDPVINPLTRTARVRGEVKNPEGSFKPEMYLQVEIRVPQGRKLCVPREAVLDTGERRLVFVADGEHFEPREVRVGAEADGSVPVLSGLTEGERVVTSANFLIDSEAQFANAAESFRKRGGTPSGGAAPGGGAAPEAGHKHQ